MSTTKRTTSTWRQYFHVDNKSGNARCKYCPKILKTCSNTTNLKQHMERKHSSLINYIENKEVSAYNLDLIRREHKKFMIFSFISFCNTRTLSHYSHIINHTLNLAETQVFEKNTNKKTCTFSFAALKTFQAIE